MEMLTPVSNCRHTTVRFTTRQPTEFIDITDRLREFVAASRIRSGCLNVQALHTTMAIIVNEHEPLLLRDFQSLFDSAVPQDDYYRHDDTEARTVNVTELERRNGHAHCRALLLPSSVCLNITHGSLVFGRWQRVFAVEFDGPREREISVMAIGEAGL